MTEQEFVDAYYYKTFDIAKRRMSGADGYEDVAQMAFLCVLEKFRSGLIDTSSNVTGYIARTVLTKYRDYSAKNEKMLHLHKRVSEGFIDCVQDRETIFVNDELVEECLRRLDRLDGTRLEAVIAYIAGENPVDASSRMGLSKTAVYHYLKKVRAK